MRIAICGANGFIGTQLSRALVNSGYEVVRIGREHFKNPEALKNSLEGCEVIVNFCGAPIIKKWDQAYKNELYVSRIETSKKLIKEIGNLEDRPKLFISASSVGIYEENLVHEDDSTRYSTSYLALLVKQWEYEASKAKEHGLRSVIFRLGAVLGKDGGVIEEFKLACKIGIGAIPADGKQPFSWVHIDDVCVVLKNAIKDYNMKGIYNLVAPQRVNMKTFVNNFAKIVGRPVCLSIPEFLMKMRYAEGAESILKSSFVISRRLEKEGYNFKYDTLSTALVSILKS